MRSQGREILGAGFHRRILRRQPVASASADPGYTVDPVRPGREDLGHDGEAVRGSAVAECCEGWAWGDGGEWLRFYK
jgi:hypothetical protein